MIGSSSTSHLLPSYKDPLAWAVLPLLWRLPLSVIWQKWLVSHTLLLVSSEFLLIAPPPLQLVHMSNEISPLILLVSHSSDFLFLLPCCLWPSIIKKRFREGRFVLRWKCGWKWWHGNEAMGKVCGNCLSCLFPAALVSSGLSVFKCGLDQQ